MHSDSCLSVTAEEGAEYKEETTIPGGMKSNKGFSKGLMLKASLKTCARQIGRESIPGREHCVGKGLAR